MVMDCTEGGGDGGVIMIMIMMEVSGKRKGSTPDSDLMRISAFRPWTEAEVRYWNSRRSAEFLEVFSSFFPPEITLYDQVTLLRSILSAR